MLLYSVFVYNRLVQDRNIIDKAWSGIDVQLKRRHNLVPKPVETARAAPRTKPESSKKSRTAAPLVASCFEFTRRGFFQIEAPAARDLPQVSV